MSNFYGGRPGQDYGIDTIVPITSINKNTAKFLSEELQNSPFGLTILIYGTKFEKAYCKVTNSKNETVVVNLHNSVWRKGKNAKGQITYTLLSIMSSDSGVFKGCTAETYNDWKALVELEEGSIYIK